MTELRISPDLASALADSAPEVVAQIEQSIHETLARAEPAISRYFTGFPPELAYDPVAPFSGGQLFAWLQSLLLDVAAIAPQYVEEVLYASLVHAEALPEGVRTHYHQLVQEIFSRQLSDLSRATVLDLIVSVTLDAELHSYAVVGVSMALIASLARTLYRAPIVIPQETLI